MYSGLVGSWVSKWSPQCRLGLVGGGFEVVGWLIVVSLRAEKGVWVVGVVAGGVFSVETTLSAWWGGYSSCWVWSRRWSWQRDLINTIV